MSSHPYYHRYTADFSAATSHLSLAEVGAYNRLLDWQYENGHGLDPNPASLNRISGSQTRAERLSVKKVTEEFFEAREDDGGKLWNPRAYQEVEKRKVALAKMSKAGAKGARKRWGTPPEPHAPENGVPHRVPNRVGGATRARPDPYKDLKHPNSELPVVNSPARAREAPAATASSGGLTDEQRAAAQQIQDQLEQRRQAAGVESVEPRQVAACVTPLSGEIRNSEFEGEKGDD